MMEIELKSPCKDIGALRERLLELNAVFSRKERQKDVYYTHPSRDFGNSDEALRIRHQDGGAYLHYKGPRTIGCAKSREELGLGCDDGNEMDLILRRLGFMPRYEVLKERESYIIDDCEVSLDIVEGLGSYVEIEYIGQECQGEAAVKCLAEELGLKSSENRSYLELLHFAEGVDG